MRTLLSILILGCVAAVRSAEVSGSVQLSNGRPGGSAVVFLQGSERSRPLSKAVVDQRDRKFVPHVSVVTVNTKVEFPNNDSVFHNVFTEYHATRFDLGMYPRGSKKERVFDRPGLAVLMCSVHPSMSAYVMVVDTPYYTVANGAGRFTLSGVPPGKYQLHIWHETGEQLVQDVTVAQGSSFEVRTSK